MRVYIGDMCHVLPRRVMDEFQNPWVGSRQFCDDTGLCHQYLYGEVNTDVSTHTPVNTDDDDDEDTLPDCFCVDDCYDIPDNEQESMSQYEDKFFFSICSTWNGDGFFKDQDGNSYGVDMGCLGVVCVEDEIEKSCQDCERSGLGKIWELPERDDFGDPPTSWVMTIPRMVRDNNGTFTFGDNDEVVIHTGWTGDDEEDEEE